MQIRVFILDKKNEFVETFDEQLINEPIEKIKKLELSPVNEIIESFKESDYPKSEIKVLRWTVLYKNHIVTVSCDIALVYWLKSNEEISYKLRRYTFENVSFKTDGNRIIPKNKCKNIPIIVGKAAIEYLSLETKNIYDITPNLTYNEKLFSNGRTLIDAFFKYPIDINLWFIIKFAYSSHNVHFSDLFYLKDKDIFGQICERIHLEKTDWLKTNYEANPFSIILIKRLNKLGIEKRENLEKFFNLTTWNGKDLIKESYISDLSITFSKLSPSTYSTDYLYKRMFENPEECISMFTIQYNPLPNDNLFYCNYIKYYHGEDVLADRLLYMQLNWDEVCSNLMFLLVRNFHIISENIRNRILNENISNELYKALKNDIETEKQKKCTFHYNKEYINYQCTIDNYEFKLVQNSDELIHILKATPIPVLAEDGIVYYSISENNKVKACLRLDNVFSIHSTNNSYPYTVPAQIRIAVIKWLKRNNLHEKYGPYFRTEYKYLMEELS